MIERWRMTGDRGQHWLNDASAKAPVEAFAENHF
jgi:hypothetical protein